MDGKFVAVGEDVLKTKSSFRTIPLLPAGYSNVPTAGIILITFASTTADIYSHLDFHAQIESGLVMNGMFERNRADLNQANDFLRIAS